MIFLNKGFGNIFLYIYIYLYIVNNRVLKCILEILNIFIEKYVFINVKKNNM